MQEQRALPASAPNRLARRPRKPNRGSFKPGDPRINLRGRPKGLDAQVRRAKVGRPLCGRLKKLFVPSLHFRVRLLMQRGPWLARRLPVDFCIVGCEVDRARDGIMLTLHSDEFPEVLEGQLIPEITPDYNGLNFLRPALLAFDGII